MIGIATQSTLAAIVSTTDTEAIGLDEPPFEQVSFDLLPTGLSSDVPWSEREMIGTATTSSTNYYKPRHFLLADNSSSSTSNGALTTFISHSRSNLSRSKPPSHNSVGRFSDSRMDFLLERVLRTLQHYARRLSTNTSSFERETTGAMLNADNIPRHSQSIFNGSTHNMVSMEQHRLLQRWGNRRVSLP